MTSAIEKYARAVCSKAWVALSVHDAPIFGSASGYLAGRNEEDGTDYLDFFLPEMVKLHQAKKLDLKVGHVIFNVVQSSNELDFTYNSPDILTIENIEGEPIMNQATTDLVIRGDNFGTNEIANLYAPLRARERSEHKERSCCSCPVII